MMGPIRSAYRVNWLNRLETKIMRKGGPVENLLLDVIREAKRGLVTTKGGDAWKGVVRQLRWEPTNEPLAISLVSKLLFWRGEASSYYLGFIGKCTGRLFADGETEKARKLVKQVALPYYQIIQEEGSESYLELEILKVLLGDFDAHRHWVPEKQRKPSYVYLEESLEGILSIGSRSLHLYIKRKAVDALYTLLNLASREEDRKLTQKYLRGLAASSDQILQDQVAILDGGNVQPPQSWTAPCSEVESQTSYTPPLPTFITISDEDNFGDKGILNTHYREQHLGLSSLEDGISREGKLVKIKGVDKRPLVPNPNIGTVAERLAYELGHYLGIAVPPVQIEEQTAQKPRPISHTAGVSPVKLSYLPLRNEAQEIIKREIDRVETVNLRGSCPGKLGQIKKRYPAGTTLGLPAKEAYRFFEQAQQLFSNAYLLDQIRFLNWIIFNEDAHVAGYADLLAVRKKGPDECYTLYAVDFGASLRCLTPASDTFNGPQSPEVHINSFKSSLNFALKHPVFMEHIYPSLEKFARLPDAILGGMVEQFRRNYLNDSQADAIKRILFEERDYARELLRLARR